MYYEFVLQLCFWLALTYAAMDAEYTNTHTFIHTSDYQFLFMLSSEGEHPSDSQ